MQSLYLNAIACHKLLQTHNFTNFERYQELFIPTTIKAFSTSDTQEASFHSLPLHFQWLKIHYLLPILFYKYLQILEKSFPKSYFYIESNTQELKYFLRQNL